MTASYAPTAGDDPRPRMRRSGPIRALIVEDEPADAKLIERVLDRLESYRVSSSVVGDLKSAQAAAARERFDVAFIDYDLGGHCGVDLVPQLAQSGSCVSVLLTGQLTPAVHERALAAGVLASLSKDRLDVSAVEVAMRQALRMRHLATAMVQHSREGHAHRSDDGLAGALPTHLVPALELLQVKTGGIEHTIARGEPGKVMAAEMSMLRHLIGDLSEYCRDTMNIVFSLEDELNSERTVDVQSVLLDALNMVYAERRRRDVRFLLDLNDMPLAARASSSVLRCAFVDMLSVVLHRTMPGGRIGVGVTSEHGGIIVTLTSDEIVSGQSEVRLRLDRLASRCRALLKLLGGHAVLFEEPRDDGFLGTIWLPLAGKSLDWAERPHGETLGQDGAAGTQAVDKRRLI